MSNQAEYARRKRTFFHRLDDLQQNDETVEGGYRDVAAIHDFCP